MGRSRTRSMFPLLAGILFTSSCAAVSTSSNATSRSRPSTVEVTAPPAAASAASSASTAAQKLSAAATPPTSYATPAPVAITTSKISVKTAAELMAALEKAADTPGTEVVLEPGEYNITSFKTKKRTAHFYWAGITSDLYPSLTLDSISNFKLSSRDPKNPGKIVTDDRASQVITFVNGTNIEIADIVAGHTKSADEVCLAVVIAFSGVHDILIRGSVLFGSGTHGVSLQSVENFTMFDSTIKDCTQGHAVIDRSKNITFTRDRFIDTHGTGFSVSYSTGVVIEGSEFSNNELDVLFHVDVLASLPSTPVVVRASKFASNRVRKLEDKGGSIVLQSPVF